ncbi:MAG TPA: CPBP family intramembrane glutamic endopeptidase [Propionibacteriaceae bacterium]|nr:CPBP family intramembrane glutamic endopeptidase [Propionibacteriaceae bacterium]
MSLVRRYPLTAFVVLACALSWWPWILYSLDLLPTPIVGFGPFLAALVVLAVTEGKRGVLGLLRRMVRWRVGLQWYAAALLLPIVVTLAAAALNVFLLGAQRTSSVSDLGGWSSLLVTFLLWLLIPGLAGTWEEPGFRGYALPRLQARHSALAASLILGVLWAFWHLPFVVTGEDIWIDALLFPIEWSIVYTWLFNNAKGSVLIVMLFHNMNNTFSSGFVGRMFSGEDSVNQAWLRLLLWGVVAIVLVVVYGSRHLSRKYQKQVEPAQPEVPAASPQTV